MTEEQKHLLRQVMQHRAPVGCPSDEALKDFQSGGSTDGQRAALEAHLRMCGVCLDRLIDLEVIASVAEDESDETASLDFTNTLKQRLVEAGAIKPEPTQLPKPIPPQKSTLWERVRAWWTTPGVVPALAAVAAVLVIFRLLNPFESAHPRTARSPFILHQINVIVGSIEESGQETLAKGIQETLEKTKRATVVVVSDVMAQQGREESQLSQVPVPRSVGVVVNSHGLVLTYAHAVRGAREIAVIFDPRLGHADPRGYRLAQVVKTNREADLALLKIENPPVGLNSIILGQTDNLVADKLLYFLGYYMRSSWRTERVTETATDVDFEWKSLADDQPHRSKVIQTTTRTPNQEIQRAPGLLVNMNGQLMGLNVHWDGDNFINSAISIDVIRKFVRDVD